MKRGDLCIAVDYIDGTQAHGAICVLLETGFAWHEVIDPAGRLRRVPIGGLFSIDMTLSTGDDELTRAS
jgi:hypothetical protein